MYCLARCVRDDAAALVECGVPVGKHGRTATSNRTSHAGSCHGVASNGLVRHHPHRRTSHGMGHPSFLTTFAVRARGSLGASLCRGRAWSTLASQRCRMNTCDTTSSLASLLFANSGSRKPLSFEWEPPSAYRMTCGCIHRTKQRTIVSTLRRDSTSAGPMRLSGNKRIVVA